MDEPDAVVSRDRRRDEGALGRTRRAKPGDGLAPARHRICPDLLAIDNLHATVADKPILKGLSLTHQRR